MNSTFRVLPAIVLAVSLVGCASTSSSTLAPGAQASPAYEGRVYVTEQALPAGVQFTEVALVEADAKTYGSGTKLYPMLADEARKMGANAVIEVDGGQRPTLLAWAAPWVSGKAIIIENLEEVQKLEGAEY